MNWKLVAWAYLMDLIIGDPRWLPHPVVMIGKMISFLEKHLRKPEYSKIAKRIAGAITVVAVVLIAVFSAWAMVSLAAKIHPLAGYILSIILVSSTIATRGLIASANEVAKALRDGRLEEARDKVSMIVGRDTASMKKDDVARATIETVAENLVDAVIAPMLFALLGGAPLAMAYRAVNTLDSMLGYKNEKYEDFGWAAAKLDDLANYIPARLSVLIIAMAALIYRRNPVNTVKTALRFNANHASPNSGWPEAAVAGTFNLRLGGTNYYGGVSRQTGFIGDGSGTLTEVNIKEAVTLLFISSAVALLVTCSIGFICETSKAIF